MNLEDTLKRRILAIDPTTRGFGFAVLEGRDMLIDWGVREAREHKKPRCIELFDDLLRRYQPDVIVVEDYAGKDSRRCLRVQELIDQIFKLAEERMIKTRSFSRYQVRTAFAESDAFTKHQIAEVIAKQFPELAPRVPPLRKSWMSEDYRMSIFDAVAFALTYFYFENKRKKVALS